MDIHVQDFKVTTDKEMIVLKQGYFEDSEQRIVIHPAQVDLLKKLLDQAAARIASEE